MSRFRDEDDRTPELPGDEVVGTAGGRTRRICRPLLLAVISLSAAHVASAATSVNCTSNPGALHAALVAAAPGDTLQIEGTCPGTYILEKNLTLTGKADAAIDGHGNGPVLTVVAGVHVVLDGLIVKGGASTASFAVGGISNSGDLRMTRSRVTGNAARGVDRATGGIESGPIDTASIELDRTEVFDNSATVVTSGSASAAGGMRTEGRVMLSRSEVRNNSAFASTASVSRAFGGLAIGAGPGYLDRTTVSNNVARSEHTGGTGSGFLAGATGGIIHLSSNDQLVIDKSLIERNRGYAVSAVGSGAAGGMTSRFTRITGTDVVGNFAEAGTLAAGGIANHNAVLVLDKSNIAGNIASVTEAAGTAAGGVATGYLGVASTKLTKSSVVHNSASGGGAIGGLYRVDGNGAYELTKSDVDRNTPVDCNFAGCQP